jgi:hypothetical protein
VHRLRFRRISQCDSKTVEEAVKLIEQGFEFVTDIDGVKLFRKRK